VVDAIHRAWGRGLKATAPGLKPARRAGFGDGHSVQKSSTPIAGYVLFGVVRGVICWSLLPLGTVVGFGRAIAQ
jgi:hypothetical protein